MIERAMTRSAALLVAALAVLGVVATAQLASAAPSPQGAVLAADTDPNDPYGVCQILRPCQK
jgi:hypothetical protein